ncbi:MAG: hypothetical protein NTY98_20395 [Verrucomicrobia bacterium]|nr:hypothetical protein [Verrucomicrobiota bacterium]
MCPAPHRLSRKAHESTTPAFLFPPARRPHSRNGTGCFGEWSGGERFAADLMDHIQRDNFLSLPDAAFLRDIVLTTLRNLSLLDHWIAVITEDKHLDHRSRWGLRIGLCQVLILKVSEYAAVNETVAATGRARSLINAVLRHAPRTRNGSSSTGSVSSAKPKRPPSASGIRSPPQSAPASTASTRR